MTHRNLHDSWVRDHERAARDLAPPEDEAFVDPFVAVVSVVLVLASLALALSTVAP